LKLNGKVKNITEIYFLPLVSGDTVRRGERTSNVTSFFASADDEPFSAYETKVYFDHNGNIIECYMDDSATGFHFREIFEYEGNLLINKTGLLSGEFFYKEIYRYDSKDREKERSFFDSEKHIFEAVTLEYPDKNTIIEKVHTESEYSDFERVTRFANGLPVSLVSRVDSVSIIEKWKGEYDAKGSLILSQYFDERDKLVQYTKYAYDEYGNELESLIFNEDYGLSQKYEYRYKYDGYGNWTQQVLITDNQAKIIMVRNIVYY
jgi:phospholipid N-methyltransferase